mmetsp:Transcript_1773/g.5547  ORF Transcript_1773/g.5547 Transcript_1773/m.5547 type:complete len:217 (+) Transcript_1773:863-1513(+)
MASGWPTLSSARQSTPWKPRRRSNPSRKRRRRQRSRLRTRGRKRRLARRVRDPPSRNLFDSTGKWLSSGASPTQRSSSLWKSFALTTRTRTWGARTTWNGPSKCWATSKAPSQGRKSRSGLATRTRASVPSSSARKLASRFARTTFLKTKLTSSLTSRTLRTRCQRPSSSPTSTRLPGVSTRSRIGGRSSFTARTRVCQSLEKRTCASSLSLAQTT